MKRFTKKTEKKKTNAAQQVSRKAHSSCELKIVNFLPMTKVIFGMNWQWYSSLNSIFDFTYTKLFVVFIINMYSSNYIVFLMFIITFFYLKVKSYQHQPCSFRAMWYLNGHRQTALRMGSSLPETTQGIPTGHLCLIHSTLWRMWCYMISSEYIYTWEHAAYHLNTT